MFSFYQMAGNYEDRKVGRDDFDWGFVSTAEVCDGVKPYETVVEHNRYGKMVIVENYDTKEEAQQGHTKWVNTMTSDDLPKVLVDCNNSGVAQFGAALGLDFSKPLQNS